MKVVIFFIALTLVACETPPPVSPYTKERVQEEIKQAADRTKELEAQEKENTQVLDDLQNDVFSEISFRSKKNSRPRFDVNVENMDVRDFFMSLTQDSDLNIVVHPDITGKITLSLKNVLIDEVMDVASRVYGYYVEQTPYGFHVYPVQLRTEIYQLNYLNIKRKGVSSTSVNSGQISSVGSTGGSATSSAPTAGDKSSQIDTESETDFWNEFEEVIIGLLGAGEGRRVIVNAMSGVMAVTATTSEHRTVKNFLEEMETNLRRQVVIEAKILEVELSESFQKGINWGLFSSFDGGKTVGIGNVTNGLINADGANNLLTDASQVVNEYSPDGVFGFALDLNDFKSIIQMLETQGDVNVLSSPRISTVNNQKAVIKVGNDEFFVTEFTNNTTTAGTDVVTSPEVTLTPFFSGIALDVTPQIREDNEIILHIHPSVTEVQDQVKVIRIDDSQISLPLAFSTIRESDSIVKAKNKQVIVIGGLLQTQTREETSAMPWLSKIPLLGSLFRQQNHTGKKSELVILLRPIVPEISDWADLIPKKDGFLKQETEKKTSTYRFDS